MDSESSLEALAAECLTGPPVKTSAPTMGNIQKIRYTHDALIDLIIAQPHLTQNQLAAAFGYTPAWVSNIMAADAFQAKLASRRGQLVDPVLVATIEERIRGLVIQSLDVIQQKLNEPAVKPEVALRAFELGAKGLGLGGHAAPAPVPIDLDRLAERLIQLNPNSVRTIEGQVLEKEITDG